MLLNNTNLLEGICFQVCSWYGQRDMEKHHLEIQDKIWILLFK